MNNIYTTYESKGIEISSVDIKQFKCRFPYTGLTDEQIKSLLLSDESTRLLVKQEGLKIHG